MSNSFWDDESLTWCELDCFVFEIDQELSIEGKEELVDIVVFVPMVFAFRDSRSTLNQMIDRRTIN